MIADFVSFQDKLYILSSLSMCVYSVQLEKLYLLGNKLTGGLNPAIGRLRRLKKVVLQECGLTCLPEAIGDLVMVCMIVTPKAL